MVASVGRRIRIAPPLLDGGQNLTADLLEDGFSPGKEILKNQSPFVAITYKQILLFTHYSHAFYFFFLLSFLFLSRFLFSLNFPHSEQSSSAFITASPCFAYIFHSQILSRTPNTAGNDHIPSPVSVCPSSALPNLVNEFIFAIPDICPAPPLAKW